MFYNNNNNDNPYGVFKWGRVPCDSEDTSYSTIDILSFLSSSDNYALSTERVEVNYLSHFNNQTKGRKDVLSFIGELSDEGKHSVRVELKGGGNTFIVSGGAMLPEDTSLALSEKNLYLASPNKIYFYINNNDDTTNSDNPYHFIVLD
jgi:hypothetical protein